MERRDYLMRQIEQMSQVLAALIRRLLGLKSVNIEEKTRQTTNELLMQELDTSLKEILRIPPEDIAEFIIQKKGLDKSNIELFAEVLVINAKACTDGLEKRKLFQRALELYQWIDTKSGIFSLERQKKIREIEDQIRN